MDILNFTMVMPMTCMLKYNLLDYYIYAIGINTNNIYVEERQARIK